MQNQVQIFTNKDFGRVRVIQRDGQPWWVLRDVCKALGLSNPTVVAARLDTDEVTKFNLGGLSGESNIISESGLYAVILRSDKPNARTFRKWITSEVIPSIRRHGAYINAETLERMRKDAEFTEELFDRLSAEHAKVGALMDYVETLQPKAQYYDAVMQSDRAMPVTLIAKDFGMTTVAFNKMLHNLGLSRRFVVSLFAHTPPHVVSFAGKSIGSSICCDSCKTFLYSDRSPRAHVLSPPTPPYIVYTSRNQTNDKQKNQHNRNTAF